MKIITISLPLWAALFVRDATAQTSLKTVRVNGADLHYVEQGTGPAVIFVHGGLDDYRACQPQIQAFSERYHTVAYSRRYNYTNARVAPRSDYSAMVDADDLAALIKKLRLGPARIVGVSYGAYVAPISCCEASGVGAFLVLSEPPLMRWLSELEGGGDLQRVYVQGLGACYAVSTGPRGGSESGG